MLHTTGQEVEDEVNQMLNTDIKEDAEPASTPTPTVHGSEQLRQDCGPGPEPEPRPRQDIPSLASEEVIQTLSADPYFRNTCFEVRHSQIAGLGAFAIKDLVRGDIILREKPLFISDNMRLYEDFSSIDQQAKTVALSLHVNPRIKPGTNRVAGIWSTNWWEAPSQDEFMACPYHSGSRGSRGTS